MSAYIIVDIEVKNPNEYEEYKKLALPTLKPFGGKYIVRGGKVEILEGNWNPNRFVILEFPDSEKAKAWWNSDAYTAAKSIRYRTANSKMILVEGLN
ncbi:MAG: hypothetical protein HGGPFJEG_00555 [Ignavibacteria bacterium]|nr:hypothetical protein [Ignavibacteria bacterium]